MNCQFQGLGGWAPRTDGYVVNKHGDRVPRGTPSKWPSFFMAYKWDQILRSLASPGMILQVGNPYKPSLYITLSWTNSSPLKIDRPRRKVVSQPSIFRGYVCFREGTNPKLPCKVAACYPLLMTPGGPGFSPRLFEGEDGEVVLGEATDSSTKNSTPTWDFRKDIQKDAWENVSYIYIYLQTESHVGYLS